MKTLAIRHELSDSLAVYGLRHFLFKHGLCARIASDGYADIAISQDDWDKERLPAPVLIYTRARAMQTRIVGYLKSATSVPLLARPGKMTADGDVIANFETDGESYPCIVRSGNRLDLGFDIFGMIGTILSGHLDRCSDLTESDRKVLMQTPVVDILEELLFDCLQRVCVGNGIDLEAQPFWPDGNTFALCLTHDVDRVYKTYQYVPSILRNLRKGSLSGLAGEISSLVFRHGTRNPYWTFDRITSLENKLGVKSTFFFLNEKGKLNPFSPKSWILFAGRYRIDSPAVTEAAKKLQNDGFEIGLHGSYHSYKDVSLLRSEKEQLEGITGERVVGIRQHYLNCDENTFALQQMAGLSYDSSVGLKKGAGFRTGTCFPFHPFDRGSQCQLRLLEIPLVVMDGALLPEAGFDECMKMIDVVRRHNGVLTLLWHTNEFCGVDHPGMTELYRTVVAAAVDGGACVLTAGRVHDWITKRSTGITP